MMNTAWLLNVVGLFLTTVGTLLVFLYLWRSPKFADHWLTIEGQRAYSKHRRLLIAAAGAIALWMVIEYAAIILT
jgi:hypothetical protein